VSRWSVSADSMIRYSCAFTDVLHVPQPAHQGNPKDRLTGVYHDGVRMSVRTITYTRCQSTTVGSVQIQSDAWFLALTQFSRNRCTLSLSLSHTHTHTHTRTHTCTDSYFWSTNYCRPDQKGVTTHYQPGS
jgi:hypothetical protein